MTTTAAETRTRALSAVAFLLIVGLAATMRDCVSPHRVEPDADRLLLDTFAQSDAAGVSPDAFVQRINDRVAQVLSEEETAELRNMTLDAGLSLPDDDAARFFELKAKSSKSADEYIEWNRLFRRALLQLPSTKRDRYHELETRARSAIKASLKEDR